MHVAKFCVGLFKIFENHIHIKTMNGYASTKINAFATLCIGSLRFNL